MTKKLIINGSLNTAAEATFATAPGFEEFQHFELAKSVQVSNSRSLSARQEMEITSNGDVVELRFEDRTTWIGNAQEFQEIFALTLNRGFEEDALEVPTVLRATTDRGVLQDLALQAISLFKPKKTAIVGAAVREIAKKIEEKVQPQPGLYFLDRMMRKRSAAQIKDVSKPYLLFIHGTNSNTEGAYGSLLAKQSNGLWNFIFDNYGDNVLAYDHHTLTESPLQNTRELMEALPSNITLHLITHSRGGLVGDLLARADAGNLILGFSDEEMELLKERELDFANMKVINDLARVKNIRVEKFVRVASPSMGTSLMADRLDHYLNTLLNLVGLSTGMAANPVYIGVKALLAEVASSKTNIDALPGLEAMSPESPFIKMLNNPANQIVPPLTVISGNCPVHLELKALLVILTKLYFRRKNDLVVDTWSMYFGTPRRKAVQFFLDDKQGTDHIHYFSSKDSQGAIWEALKSTTDTIEGFKPLNDAVIAEANRNAALPFIVSEVKMNTAVSGNKPIAVILPGIMGSNLYKDDDCIWVDFWRFVKGDLLQLDINATNITARSLMGSGYRRLAKYLAEAGYDVIAFAYDWRKDLTGEAEKLNALMEELLTKKQPIHVLAHSMGGVLFREFMLLKKQWDAVNASPGFRALFLGAPLGGSYLIPETLAGRGGSIAKLSLLDLKHGTQDLLKVFAACPGLYNLLPLSTAPHDFGDISVWRTLFKHTNGLGVEPGDSILKGFRAFRDRATNGGLGLSDFKNIVYVAGKDDSTTASYVIDENPRGKGLTFKSTAEGDGSVTWASGIPDVLKKADAVYYTTTIHGELANDKALFDAFRELLHTGATAALRKVPPAGVSRGGDGATGLVDKPRYEILPVTANNIEAVVLGMKPFEEAKEEARIVNISVSNGDLRDARYPIIVGHFYRDGIMGAERVLDLNFGGLLSEKHLLNLYPGRTGTADVFLSYNKTPKGAIVIGLDEPGELNGYRLELGVAQGVSRYLLALREFEQTDRNKFAALYKKGIGVSTVVVGAGYGGLSVENSIKSILLGIQKANEGIQSLGDATRHTIEWVEFVELYEDRALQAYYTIKKLEEERQLAISVPRNRIKKLFGIRKRVPLDEQQDWWQRISISIKEAKTHEVLTFSASTGAAREEVRNLRSNPQIIRQFIAQVSKNNQWTPQLAKTIFELLIPNDFKDAVRNQNNIVWKLDKRSAAFPWELLQDTATQAKPLCVNAGMVRQLATSDYRTQIQRSYKANALVVGDPLLHGFVNQLPGAVREAEEVASLIAEQGYTVTKKINTEFADIVQALFQDEYKIIHLAGHGDFDPENPDNAGMIIGDHLFLTSKEIDQMSQVPEFVFVNCCHLGEVDEAAERRAQQFYRLAANLGVQLIQMGVKAVIAAGWAVDDAAAYLFADVFYKQMFAGEPFGNAVKAARAACFNEHPESNTWGAYQCYGDQFYIFKSTAPLRKKTRSYILPVEAEVDLINIANKVESGRFDKKEILKELKAIGLAVDKSGLRDGDITEREADIFAKLNEKDIAIEKISSLRRYEEATFSVKSLEQLCNLHIKQLNGIENATEEQVQRVIQDFRLLEEIGDTCERLTLLGSAYKTLFQKAATRSGKIKALQQSALHYHKAFEVAKKNNSGILYPLCNWLQIESILLLIKDGPAYRWGGKSPNGYDLPKAKQAFDWMDKVLDAGGSGDDNLEYWKLMDRPNVLLTRLCMEPGGQTNKDELKAGIEEVWTTAGPDNKKQSELEHFQFLLAALALADKENKPKAKALGSALQNVFDELNKLRD